MSKDIRGSDFESLYPDILQTASRGALLGQILLMEKKTAINFEQASRLAEEKWNEAIKNRKYGYGPGECSGFEEHFVEWISSQGFHIEITGDEFEPFVMSDKLI